MTNPAINPAINSQPNGDVDIEVPAGERSEIAIDGASPDEQPAGHEASVDPENLDHPEELMGE